MKGLVGSFQLMKSLNKSLILNVIRTDGPISRAEIAKKTRLTPPTVTNLVNDLLESRLVQESDLGVSTGGRKPIMLKINSEAFQVIGIDVGVSHIKVIVATLDAAIIDSLYIKVIQPLDKESLIKLLNESIRRIMEKAALRKERVIGIGVGMHGLVNPDRGVGIFAPNFNLHDIPIRESLESEWDLPVEVENDVRAMALGESWFGHGQGLEDFICLNVGMGVGAGIILNQELFRGTSYTAGELGHTTIDVEGPTCACGNDGCLQALTAGPAIAARAQRGLRMGRKSRISEFVQGDWSQMTGETVYQAACQGDEFAREILADTGRYLGIGIANFINTLNPQKVIIGGGVSKSGDFIMETLKETVETRALNISAKAIAIQTAKLGDDATAIGAATLVLKKLFLPNIPHKR
ncbi:ROK family transcriptional regulator [Paludifilum halophilum]|uniref:ROK family transcriptional regulator n=1 Tax=Paludifilum halophilum TaxID=1642702 RepID=UPI001F0AA3ED|nr:ROK family transcriptional regulator [Paludifilum halophilum]